MRCPNCGETMRLIASEDDVDTWVCPAQFCGYEMAAQPVREEPWDKLRRILRQRGGIRGVRF